MSAEGEKNGNGALRPTLLIGALVLGVLTWAGQYVAGQALEASKEVIRLRGEFGGDLKAIRSELERAKSDVAEIRRLVERIDSRSRKRDE